MKKKIVVIPGDGIGGEITDAAVKVLKKTAAILMCTPKTGRI